MLFPSVAFDAIQGTHGKGLVISTYVLYSELIFIFYLTLLRRVYIYQRQELCLKHCLPVCTLHY